MALITRIVVLKGKHFFWNLICIFYEQEYGFPMQLTNVTISNNFK